MTANHKLLTQFLNDEFGLRLIQTQHAQGLKQQEAKSPLELGNPLPTLFKEIHAKVTYFEDSAMLQYKYTPPNGGTNGYTLGYARIKDGKVYFEGD